VLASDLTRHEISRLFCCHGRVQHYLFGLWIDLAGRSAMEFPDGRDYVLSFAASLINKHKQLAWEIDEVVERGEVSARFLAAHPRLRNQVAEAFVRHFPDFSGRAFPLP
jgi:hypothetical protein